MTPFTELLASLRRGNHGRIEATIPEDWMQGRTTYGGLTAALCLESALELADGMPVRSVQIAFIGPAGGEIVISPSLLRRGKNSAFINVDMVGEAGIAARGLFAFGARRDSAIEHSDLVRADVPEPGDCGLFFPENAPRPGFMQHFETRLAHGAPPVSGAESADIGLWLRHRDEATLFNATSLLALADAPPPAAMAMFAKPGPISSMTWMAEFLAEDVTTDEGWYFARHAAQSIRNGYSSQSMRLWTHQGKPVMAGRQTIAVFV